MEILNQIMADTNPLATLLADPVTNHIGYVYSMGFKEAMVLTNDAWKERVAGIPHNSFLIAASFDPAKFANALELDKEIVLLRVLGPANLPQDVDMLRTRIEHSQRRTADELFGQDIHDGLDPLTYIERVLAIRKLIYICHSWPKKRQNFLSQRRKPVNHMMRLFSGRNFKAVNAVQKLK